MVLAVDFGTSNTLLAIVEDGVNKGTHPIDPDAKDQSIMKSVLYFPKGEDPYFGQAAINTYNDNFGEGRFIQSIKKYLPIKSFKGTQINNKFYSIEEIIACFLRELKDRVQFQRGKSSDEILLGRPAKFSMNVESHQLAVDRLEKAAQLAGFKDIHFCPEPIAAAFEFKKTLTSEKIVLVVDLGGGTSDFTVIRLSDKKFSQDDVLGLGGISVAGNSLDGCIMKDKVSKHLGSNLSYQLPMSSNVLTMPQSLKYNLMSPADIVLMSKKNIMSFLNELKKCSLNELDKSYLNNLFTLIDCNLGYSMFASIESTKLELCAVQESQFSFSQDGICIEESITYNEFKDMTQSKINEIFKTLDSVMTEAQVNSSNIDLICCTGGTSHVPEVKSKLLNRFGEEKIKTFRNFHSVINGLGERALELF